VVAQGFSGKPHRGAICCVVHWRSEPHWGAALPRGKCGQTRGSAPTGSFRCESDLKEACRGNPPWLPKGFLGNHAVVRSAVWFTGEVNRTGERRSQGARAGRHGGLPLRDLFDANRIPRRSVKGKSEKFGEDRSENLESPGAAARIDDSRFGAGTGIVHARHEKQIARLREQGRLFREGSARAGHWRVAEE